MIVDQRRERPAGHGSINAELALIRAAATECDQVAVCRRAKIDTAEVPGPAPGWGCSGRRSSGPRAGDEGVDTEVGRAGLRTGAGRCKRDGAAVRAHKADAVKAHPIRQGRRGTHELLEGAGRDIRRVDVLV